MYEANHDRRLPEEDETPKLLDGLVSKELHLALLLEPINDENVHSRRLCEFPVRFIASEEIKFARKSLALEDIVKHWIITFAGHTQPYLELEELLDSAKLDATIWASGCGVAVIPTDVIAKRADTRKELRALNTEIKLLNLDYAVGWPTAPRDIDGRTARKVIDIAVQIAKEWPKLIFSSVKNQLIKLSK